MSRPLKGLIVGLANADSIAYGCAKAFKEQGASLAVTYQSEKAKPYVEPLAKDLGSDIFMPLDVRSAPQMQALFDAIAEKWGRLDFVLHSVAFAPKDDLQGRFVDSSVEGFTLAMDISCHSLVRLAKAAEPLMSEGGALLTMSYYGAEKVVDNYNLMGPVKAALEASVRYLAKELGPQNIRINALSPGPVATRAASGLAHFDALMAQAATKAPLHQQVSIEQIGHAAAFLVSDNAQNITGQVIYVDNGYSALG
ncbi:enoyl-ACP reductase FabI [Gallaecimonas mangrovi]|uniref:enoyl-ACP reductase FabI n=1 Tax=Gallaecimonas mangrovi TaxID=2291597 RepID=UPI000E206419|nr:enoyl-ACP reductase FabI [Gallaecimonas mangrovi]